MTTNYKLPDPVNKFSHPDLVGGIVWSDYELAWINKQILAAYEAGKAEYDRMMNSPTIEACRQMIENKAVVEASELHAQLAAAQAHIEQLREALYDQLNDCINFDGGKLTTCIMEASTKALALESSADALREHDTELVGRIATSFDQHPLTTWISDRIRREFLMSGKDGHDSTVNHII